MIRNNWKKIGRSRRAGLLAPLFSVYSKDSVGIGDFDDLKLLIDLCAKTGNSILQLLPMNEVSSTFCPYDAISSFALEPAYISLKAFKAKSIKALKEKFPATGKHVNYRIKDEKLGILREVYSKDRRPKTGDQREFEKFCKENRYWLDDFALFKVLKDYHRGGAWYQWEDGYKNRDRATLDAFREEYADEISFQKWIQWELYKQFKEAKSYAVSRKVLLNGDLPILVSRDSADVWSHPELFKLEFAAGAPPDMYCAKGQRWGMPTYNWEAIARDGYGYIKEKLKFAENFYDILRIDHVVGLFRIWNIPYNDPLENVGLNGSFDPKDENLWEEHGRRLLSVFIDSADMLLCAEDLGIIPKVCPTMLKDLGIPGNDVQRWTKDWNMKHDFLKPNEYRELSIAVLSTHDTTNWAAWWENEAGTADEALFMRKCSDRVIDYNHVKGILFDPVRSRHGRLRWRKEILSTDIFVEILGKRREEISDFIEIYENTYDEKEKLWTHMDLKGAMRERCDPDIINAALKIILRSRSVFCIQLIVDWLMSAGLFKGDPYAYRVNTPGTIGDTNWSLRIPVSLEGLLKDRLCSNIKIMIRSSDRT